MAHLFGEIYYEVCGTTFGIYLGGETSLSYICSPEISLYYYQGPFITVLLIEYVRSAVFIGIIITHISQSVLLVCFVRMELEKVVVSEISSHSIGYLVGLQTPLKG